MSEIVRPVDGQSARVAMTARLSALQREDGGFNYVSDLFVALGVVESRMMVWFMKCLRKYGISTNSKIVTISNDVFSATVLAVAAMRVPLRDQEQVWAPMEARAVLLLRQACSHGRGCCSHGRGWETLAGDITDLGNILSLSREHHVWKISAPTSTGEFQTLLAAEPPSSPTAAALALPDQQGGTPLAQST